MSAGRAVREPGPFGAMPQSLPALTSVRFFLALGVVVFHYQFNTTLHGVWPTELIGKARLGVDAFFILSGFVMAHVYGAELAEGRYSHRRFLWARVARIYPAHVAMLALMLGVAGAALVAGEVVDPERYSALGFIQTLFLTHAWLPSAQAIEWNGPSWSLSAEWAAYLAFPLLAAVALWLRRRPLALCALAAATFGGLDWAYRAMFGTGLTSAEFNLGVLRIIPEFLLGIGLRGVAGRLEPGRGAAVLLASAAAGALLALMHFGADDRMIVAASGGLILTLALLAKAGVGGWLDHKALVAAGEASYALYVIHFPLLAVWRNARGVIFGVRSDYLMQAWELALFLSATIAGAFALHALWERPARRWIRRRFLDAPAGAAKPGRGGVVEPAG